KPQNLRRSPRPLPGDPDKEGTMNPSISRYDKRQFRAPLAGLAALAVLAVSLLACGGSDDRASEDSSTALGSSGMATGGSFSPSAPDAPGANAARDGDFSGSRAESGAADQLPGAAQTSAGEAQPIADVLGRQVIRNGSVELIVESVSDSFDEVRGVVDQAGGYLASSSFSGQDE